MNEQNPLIQARNFTGAYEDPENLNSGGGIFTAILTPPKRLRSLILSKCQDDVDIVLALEGVCLEQARVYLRRGELHCNFNRTQEPRALF